MGTERYQTGSLEKLPSPLGMCWWARFREYGDGEVRRRRIRVGLVSEYPTKTAARRAAEEKRKELNATVAKPVFLFRHLVQKYEKEDMPERYSTSQSYRSMIKVHLLPKWGSLPIADVSPGAVKEWLKGLHTAPRKSGGATRPLAPKTKGHIKALMSVFFRYAMLHGYITAAVNPMTLFPLSTPRTKEPRILAIEIFRLLIIELTAEPFRTMVIVAACLGLSCSELIGIRWGDIDWIGMVVNIRRGVVSGHVGDVKNRFREKPLPLSPYLIKVLEAHFAHTEKKARGADKFVFASPYTDWKSPYDPGEILKTYIRPAAIDMEIKRAKLEKGGAPLSADEYANAIKLAKKIGWHTFRHSYRAWLGAKGTEMEIQRDLMRHSNISTTMNTYGGTFPEGLREANEKVVEGLLQ